MSRMGILGDIRDEALAVSRTFLDTMDSVYRIYLASLFSLRALSPTFALSLLNLLPLVFSSSYIVHPSPAALQREAIEQQTGQKRHAASSILPRAIRAGLTLSSALHFAIFTRPMSHWIVDEQSDQTFMLCRRRRLFAFWRCADYQGLESCK